MDEILKEVLVKKCGNRRHDQVLIVENLPRKFLFEQTRKLVPRIDKDGWMDGTMAVDPSGEMIWTLYPGIERSQTGDGGYVFNVGDREGDERLKDLMRYIDMSFPRDQRLPEFIDNAQMRGESNSGPILISQIPRISLPAPIVASPVVQQILPVPVPVSSPVPQVLQQEPAGNFKPLRKKWVMSEAHKEKLRMNLARARQARKEKVAA